MNAQRLLPVMIVLALVGLLCVVAARASDGAKGDLIVERSFVRDAPGELTIESVAALAADAFTPFSGPLGLGNSGTPTWLRLVVPAMDVDERERVLLLQPATLESVRVFIPTEVGWTVAETGSGVDFVQRPMQSLNPSVLFTPRADGETVLYVRVQTRTATVHPQVLTQEAAMAFDTKLHVGMGLYLGFTLVMTLLSALLWVSTRNPLWGLAALFDLVTLTLSSMPLGLMAKFVLPQAGELLPSLWIISAATHLLLACLLWARMIRMLEAPRWTEYGYYAVLPLAPLWLVMLMMGRGDAALVQVNLIILLITLWGILPTILIRTPDPVLRWLFRAFNGALIAYLLLFILPIVGGTKANWLNLYPTIPSNLVTMVMVVALLARRTMLDLRERSRLERVQFETAQRLALEQAHHAETSGMLGMIMHEVKNPLATISMASELLSTGRARSPEEEAKRFGNIQHAVESINTVLQRCLEVDRLDHGALQQKREDEDISALLQHWLSRHPHRARIAVELPETLIAHVDAGLLLLLLGNLVDNALQYSPPDSRVTLRLRQAEAMFELTVTNPVGRAGWPDETRLFQKYYRSATAQRDSGSGLGLYWVSAVCEVIGGTVRYTREHDDVVFTLVMPR